jgi:hypothetical protein
MAATMTVLAAARQLGARGRVHGVRRLATAATRAAAPEGPSLRDFLRPAGVRAAVDAAAPVAALGRDGGAGRFFLEVYGCQMNTNDAEVVSSLLHKAGYTQAATAEDADAVLLVTCAVRDHAERKIWSRLEALASVKVRPPTATHSGRVCSPRLTSCVGSDARGRTCASACWAAWPSASRRSCSRQTRWSTSFVGPTRYAWHTHTHTYTYIHTHTHTGATTSPP